MRLSEELRDTTFAGAFVSTPAPEIVAGLRPGWSSFNVLTSGRSGQNMADFVDALLSTEAGRGATGIDVMTWAFTVDAYARRWMDRFKGRVRLVADSFQLARRPRDGRETPWDRVIAALGGWESGRVRAGALHAKVIRLAGVPLTVVSSGNVEAKNYRVEVVSASRCEDWNRAVGAWFDVVWAETEPRPDGRRIGDREFSRGHQSAVHALAVAARSGEVAGGVLAPPEVGTRAGSVSGPSTRFNEASGASGGDDTTGRRPRTVGQLAVDLRREVEAKLGGVTEPADLASLSLALMRAYRIRRTDAARRERAERERAELKLERERGGWLSVGEVVEGFGAEHVRLRDGLADLAERARLETLDGEDVIAWFDAEIRAALERLSRGAPPPGMPAAVADALREAGREAAGKGATG